MIAAAADAVARLSDATRPGAPLLPPVSTCARCRLRSRSPSREAAVAEGLAQTPLDNPIEQVRRAMWRPDYPRVEAKPLVRKSVTRGTRATPVRPRTTLRCGAPAGRVCPGVDAEPGHPRPDRGGRTRRSRGARAARRAGAGVRRGGPRPHRRRRTAARRRRRRGPRAARHLPARHVRAGGAAPAAGRGPDRGRHRHHPRPRPVGRAGRGVVRGDAVPGQTLHLGRRAPEARPVRRLPRVAGRAGPARRPGRDRQPVRCAAGDHRERGPAEGDQPRVVADGRRHPAHGPGAGRAGRAPGGRGRRSARGPPRRSPGSWACRG